MVSAEPNASGSPLPAASACAGVVRSGVDTEGVNLASATNGGPRGNSMAFYASRMSSELVPFEMGKVGKFGVSDPSATDS